MVLNVEYVFRMMFDNDTVLATTERNGNAAMILLYLYKMIEVHHFILFVDDAYFVQVFNEYFKELEEESIRDNFVIIYELMDEMMDFGYPQTTEPKILQQYAHFIYYLLLYLLHYNQSHSLHHHITNTLYRYITQEGFKLDRGQKAPAVPSSVTGAVSWRSDNIKYRKNEVFLDVVESINLMVCNSLSLCTTLTILRQ